MTRGLLCARATHLVVRLTARAAIPVLLCGVSWLPAHADKRVALVIGNSAYEHTSKLANPRNDAADMAAVLKELGFNVMEGGDLNKAAMDRQIRDFGTALTGADLGVLFYAGHGLQVAEQNYLVPTDANLRSAATLDFEMVRLDLVQRTMERAAKTNILFLDACRDNPLARNLARVMDIRSNKVVRGLASVESGVGTLISFSTQPGNVAEDGVGRNSPFTGALVKRIRTAPVTEDLSRLLINVRNTVWTTTNHQQLPWEHSALFAPVYFTALAKQPPPPEYGKEFELAFWNFVKDTKSPGLLNTYIEKHPNGHFVETARVRLQELKKERDAIQNSRPSDNQPKAVEIATRLTKLEIKSKEEGGFTYRLGEVKAMEHQLPAAADCSVIGPTYAMQLPTDIRRDNTRFWVRIGPGDIGYCQRGSNDQWHVEYYNRDVQDGLVVLHRK